MEKEDLEFLKKLKHEILTQDNAKIRTPVYFAVRRKHREYGVSGDNSDGWAIFSNFTNENIAKPNDYRKTADAMLRIYKGCTGSDYEDKGEFEDAVSGERIDIMVSLMNEALEDPYAFWISYYKEEYVIDSNPIFLTRRECEEYIRRYSYSYRFENARPIALYGGECKTFARLMKIVAELED